MTHHQTTADASHHYCDCNLPLSNATIYCMITYIYHSLLGVTGHRCGPSLSLRFGIDLKHCAGFSPFNLVRAWSPVLIHVPGRLWCEVRLLARERGVFSSCLRSQLTVSSSHLSMLTAIWSYYLSCRDRFMCDVLYAHWGLFVQSVKCVQSPNRHRVERQDREQEIWWDVGVVLEVGVKTGKSFYA